MRTLSALLCVLAASIAVSACQLEDSPDSGDDGDDSEQAATLSSKRRPGGGGGGVSCYMDIVRNGCNSCVDYRGRPGELSEVYEFCCSDDGCEWSYIRDNCKYEPACVLP